MMLSPRSAAAKPPETFRHIALGLMLWAGLWGIATAWVWGVSWHLFGDLGTSELVMPAACAAALLVLLPLREAIAALARTIAPRRPTVRAIVSAAVVMLLTLAFYRLRADWARNEYALPWAVAWARPLCKIYRVLIVMPLWGVWSMLIACQFCRSRAAAPTPASELARSCGPLTAALWMAVVLAVSMAYYSYLGPGAQLVIPAVTLAAAIAAPLIFCRLRGQLTRTVLLAGSAVAQLAHLLVFLVYQ